MLPAQYRMRRSTDFGATVKHGRRATQPDIVVHLLPVAARADVEDTGVGDTRIGLIIAKSVGSAVQRHRVARRLRHVARELLGELKPGEQLVIRARPGSSTADSAQLEQQLRTGLGRIHAAEGAGR